MLLIYKTFDREMNDIQPIDDVGWGGDEDRGFKTSNAPLGIFHRFNVMRSLPRNGKYFFLIPFSLYVYVINS